MLNFTETVFLIFIILLLIIAWWYLTIPSNLPPGPLGYPVVGSMFDFWNTSGMLRKMHDWTRRYGPVYKFYVADKLVVVLGDRETISEALVQQSDVYAGRPKLQFFIPAEVAVTPSFTYAEGELWKEQRRFAVFTLRNLGMGRSAMEPKIKNELHYLLEECKKYNGTPFDPLCELNKAIANINCILIFGKRFDYNDRDFQILLATFRQTASGGEEISILSPFVLSQRVSRIMAMIPMVSKFANRRSEIGSFLQNEIAKWKRNNISKNAEDQSVPSSYIGAFLKAQKELGPGSSFTDSQLLANVFALFVAGTHDVTTHVLWGLFYLAVMQKIQEQFYQEIHRFRSAFGKLPSYCDLVHLPLTDAVINELLRITSLPLLGFFRRTTACSELHGYTIPEDTVVVPLISAVLSDLKVYPNPYSFDPMRFLFEDKNDPVYKIRISHLIPFQSGKRACPGESLAREEMFLFLTQLVATFQFSFPLDDDRAALIKNFVPAKTPPSFKLCAMIRK